MAKPLTYAFVGCGGVGGYYGACLQRAGLEVHFLVRSDYAFMASNGLRIESKNGDFHLDRVNVYQDPGQMPRCDVVVVTLKTTANAQLPVILPKLVKENTTVLLIQNGMGQEELISRIVPARNIIGALAFLCSQKAGPGHIRHLDYGDLTFAQFTPDGSAGGITPDMRRIADDFVKAGLGVKLLENLTSARWHKLVWNAPFNGLTVILNTTTDAIMKNPQTRALALRVMNEVVAAAAAGGHRIEPSFIERMTSYTDNMIPYAPSMKLDYDNGREMEVEAIYGIPIARGEQKGASVPILKTMYSMLSFINEQINAGRR